MVGQGFRTTCMQACTVLVAGVIGLDLWYSVLILTSFFATQWLEYRTARYGLVDADRQAVRWEVIETSGAHVPPDHRSTTSSRTRPSHGQSTD
jgi:hypothetical protein